MNPRELDLTFNPFEDDASPDEPTPQNRPYFGSAFLPNVTTPTSRRRSSFGSSNGHSSTIRKRHTRSRTEFNVDVPDPEISGHPLKSAALRSAAFQNFEVTRPHLSRIVQNTGVMRRSRSQEPEDTGDRSHSAETTEEKEVIIHEITSSDSLAGVSLRYGIPLPELRRANQLWASDSIHLRRVLYIPVDRAKRAHEYMVAGSQRSAPPSPTSDAPTPHLLHTPRSTTSSHPSPASPSKVNKPRIERMPVSQLSFFPPSSNTSRVHTPAATPSPIKTEFNSHRTPYLKPNAGTRTGPSPANSLSSLLNTLPIAASTRDEIVSRLSFDSVSSSYSDRPTPGSRRSSDEEIGHEMDDVNDRTASARVAGSRVEPPLAQTPRPHFSSDIPLSSTTQTHPLLSTSPPSSYVPQQLNSSYIRTQQLEPSPLMQIPSRSARDLARTRSIGRASSKDIAKLSLYPPNQAERLVRPVGNSRRDDGNGEHDIELDYPS